MKKLICVFLCICVVFVSSGCCINIPASDGVTEEVIENLTDFLEAKNRIISGAQWASAYVKDFCSSPDIIGYNNSICAVFALLDDLRTLVEDDLPFFTLDDEDYSKALKKGADISFLASEFTLLEDRVLQGISEWDVVGKAFFSDAYWEYGLEWISGIADYYDRYSLLDAEYYRLMTNYILCELGEKGFPSEMTEEFTAIFPSGTEFNDNLESLEKMTDECLDRTAELELEYAQLDALWKTNFDMLEKAVGTGDYGEFYARALSWGDRCMPLAGPGWTFSRCFCIYFGGDETGDVTYNIKPGDDLQGLQCSYSVLYEETDKGQFIEYLDIMENYGAFISVRDGSVYGEEEYSVYLEAGDTLNLLYWNNGNVSYLLDDNSILCPVWYFNYRSEKVSG